MCDLLMTCESWVPGMLDVCIFDLRVLKGDVCRHHEVSLGTACHVIRWLALAWLSQAKGELLALWRAGWNGHQCRQAQLLQHWEHPLWRATKLPSV